jgi:hypothetical protein
MKLRFGKEWKEDILSIPKNEMFELFKKTCVNLAIVGKDLGDANKRIKELEAELKNKK